MTSSVNFNQFDYDWLIASMSGRTLSEDSDVGETIDTSVELFSGDTFNGALGFEGDRDWFYVELQAGFTYTFTMTPGTMLDPCIRFASSTGYVFTKIDWGYGTDTETFEFTSLETSFVYVIADSFYTTDEYYDSLVEGDEVITDTGTYTLAISAEEFSGTPLDAIAGDYVAPSTINVYYVPGGLNYEDRYGQQISGAWDIFELQQAMLVFDTFEAVANVSFNIVADPSEADFFMLETSYGEGYSGYAAVGGGRMPLDGTSYDLDGWMVFVNSEESWNEFGLRQGGFSFNTLIHEMGHALGLAHPHDSGFGSSKMAGVFHSYDGGYLNLNYGINTMMSYMKGWNTFEFEGLYIGMEATPMAFDIAVLQDKYGANTNTNAGDNIYDLSDNDSAGSFYSCIWDAGGTDTIRHNGIAAAVIDLRAASLLYEENGGGFVSYQININGGFTIAANVVIENAIGGSGNDEITGNSSNNVLEGGAGKDVLSGGDGDDSLSGGGGRDTMFGGAGNDIYVVDNTSDRVYETTTTSSGTNAGGIDTVQSSVSFTLGQFIENITLTGTAAINGTGNSLNNRLVGNDRNNTLNGGEGVDRMLGGAGNDIYVVDNTSDRVYETTTTSSGTNAGGIDTVQSSVSFTLGQFVENLTLTGTAAINGTGNSLNNRLVGNDRNNTLNGGEGVDRMLGGAGNDIYVVDNTSDRVYETTTTSSGTNAGGIDTVQSSVSFTLGQFIENITLTGTAAINGTGNSLNNRLVGNAGNNTLNGGEGADTLMGGLGTDILIGGTGADRLYGGLDTVEDIFKFLNIADSNQASRDSIYNFISGTDKIDLSGIDANSNLAGNQAFLNSSINSNAQDYSIWGIRSGANFIISADTDGNVSTVDFQIQMVGVTLIDFDDFVA